MEFDYERSVPLFSFNAKSMADGTVKYKFFFYAVYRLFLQAWERRNEAFANEGYVRGLSGEKAIIKQFKGYFFLFFFIL